MKEPTMEEMQQLVDFQRNVHGHLYVHTVNARVFGDVVGSVKGNVWGNVEGTINGREWQFIETQKEKAIRLIREGRGEEAIKALEESE